MKTAFRFAAAGALTLALAACGEKSKPDPFLQNLPDAAAVTMDTTAAAPAGVTGVLVDPAPVTTVVDDLGLVHAKAQAMNEAIRDVFAHVSALTSSGGTLLPGGVKQWGPAIRCVEPSAAGGCTSDDNNAKLVLRARRWSDNLGDFVVLATSVSGTTWKPVLAGYLIRGPMDHRGAGKLFVNHENLREAAPGFRGTGYLAAGFAAGPVAKRATYRMIGFTRDSGLHPAVTAAFTGWKNGAGIVRARVAGLDADLYPGGATELGLWRAVWAPTLGGRAFTVIGRGDVTAGKYWFARACYPAGQPTPSYKEWFECDAGTAPIACVIAAAGHGTPDPAYTGLASWQETTCYWNPALHGGTAEPDELRPPGLAPGDENDERDEDGADHVGLMPEACPSTASQLQNPDPTPPGMPGGGGMMGGGMM